MITLATYNIKGGVGKTSAAVNLSVLAARDGLRTLLWDLDPQGAATFLFRVKPRVKGGARKLVRGRTDVDGLIKGTDYHGLDLLPAPRCATGCKPAARCPPHACPHKGMRVRRRRARASS